MVGPDGFEPSTPRLSSACSNQLSYEPGKVETRVGAIGAARFLAAIRAPKNGAGRVRTGDPLLAKQVLYQLSYDPVKVGKIVI
jgi:hypothetical protein